MDIIQSGGYKISALEIERVLLEHSDIAEAYVLGLPDRTWGEVVSAVVRLKSGAEMLTLEDVRSWGGGRLAKYKLPSRIALINDIPKNPTGKVNKKELIPLFRTL